MQVSWKYRNLLSYILNVVHHCDCDFYTGHDWPFRRCKNCGGRTG